MVTSLASKPKINNVFIYFLHTGKSSHRQFPEKGYDYKTLPLSENKKQKTKTTNTALFQQNSGLCSFTDRHAMLLFGTYTCTHGVNSAKNIVSCPSSFRLLQQNITDWVVFEQKFIVHGSGAWKSEMRTSKVGRCSSSGAQTSHHVLTWWISVGSLL